MPDWIESFSPEKAVTNSAGLPDVLFTLLQTYFGAVASRYPGLDQVLLRYTVDEEDERLLLHLRGLTDLGELLKLSTDPLQFFTGNKKQSSAERRSFFARIEEVPPVVAVRLGKIIEVARGPQHAQPFIAPIPAGPDEAWFSLLLEELLQNSTTLGLSGKPRRYDALYLAKVCEAGGLPASTLARMLLVDDLNPHGGWSHATQLYDNLAPYYLTYPELLLQALQHRDSNRRELILQGLIELKLQLGGTEELLATVLDLAAGGSKQIRQTAEQLLMLQDESTRQAGIAWLRDRLVNGSSGQRTKIPALLVKLEGDAALPFLAQRLEAEKAKNVRAELARFVDESATDSGDEASATPYEDGLQAPPARTFPTDYTFSQAFEEDFLRTVREASEAAAEAQAKFWNSIERQNRRKEIKTLDEKKIRRALAAMGTAEVVHQREQPLNNRPGMIAGPDYRVLREFIRRQKLELVPLIRLAFACGLIHPEPSRQERNHWFWAYKIHDEAREWLSDTFASDSEGLTLLDLASAFEAAGLGPQWVEQLYLRVSWGERFNPLDLSDDAIWPFFLVHPHELKVALGLAASSTGPDPYLQGEQRKIAFRILATFPKPPAAFASFLWERALSTSKTERALAQACLRHYPNREKRIITALEDGRKDIRASAATWLGELGVTEAIAPIRKALAKEKQDLPKAAMMESLERLGEDLDQFLNRKKLLEEAEKGLQKPLPAELDWFPFAELPEVHWEKNKQVVPAPILKWFIVQACKLKKVEPGALQRRYFSMMQPQERAALGRFIFEQWLSHDTRPKYTQAEAEQLADQQTAQSKQFATQYPQYYPNFDEHQHRRQTLGHLLNECLASASSSRGILSISAACCGPDIVPRAEKYIRYWYGRRMTQAKSLIQMLAWNDHPLAIQLILAISTRFRTKALQKEAAVCADQIAERKGWTREEMADRTIPSAGFNREGLQTIDYGTRQFTAKLMEDFSIELRNPDGKIIKALPDATKAEDADEVKTQKKEFSAAKKELKQVLKLQKERLYEAMCTQRRWPFEEWEIYLNQHPIVGRFCQQLVWTIIRDDEPAASFRPLPDGSLTDVEDAPFTAQNGDQVQIAHQTILTPEASAQWEEHLADYEVKSLFPQFGRKQFQSDTDITQTTEIAEFQGYLINSYKLRSRTTKLGYIRGSAEDGGWFYTYHKPFPGLKMQAVIEFTGNVLPEEERTVALRRLYFTKLHDDSEDQHAYSHREIRLSQIPAVMLSECWNDFKQLADDGSGFDPDWEKTAAY